MSSLLTSWNWKVPGRLLGEERHQWSYPAPDPAYSNPYLIDKMGPLVTNSRMTAVW